MNELSGRLANLSPAKRQLLEARLRRQPALAEPIAVVGMACRFAGAADLAEYWQLIRGGKDAIREIPADRWSAEEFYDPDFEAVGKMATRWCAMLEGIDRFDPLFFGISPREASKMDPQQRLLLEVAWEALENAGWPQERLAGSKTGVFVGIGGTDYSKLPSQFADYYHHIDAHVGTGNALSIAANRLSYLLDLHGPSLSVDTACSSALVGVHLAVQALRGQECDAALAGGVNAIISPEVTIAFSKARMLSPTGRCRPFDREANGYVRGEGCGMLLLKRLTDALADGDQVLALVRATAVNQDGRTSGITAPSSRSQAAVIRAALAQAGLPPERVSYIEAHGTGTPLGDPIEMQALAEVFRRTAADQPTCFVSSVKANIGHTETASGVAGLIKTILMMRHGEVPPQAHLAELNEHVHLEGTRLEIPRAAAAWPAAGETRVAGVSSFGFGGTNAHVVLEEAPLAQEAAPAEETAPRPEVFVASAKSPAALMQLAGRYVVWLDQHPDVPLAELCRAAGTERTHFQHRLAVVADQRGTLRTALAAAAENLSAAGVRHRAIKLSGRPKLAMLFTGQGSQYPGMGRALWEREPEFRRALARCDEILSELVDVPLWELLDPAPGRESLLDETAYTQPALFALEYSLAALWKSWGVEPDLVLGHSLGEYVAACVAGALSLEDGLRLVARRAQLMSALPRGGQMAVLFAAEQRVREAIRERADVLAVAAANGPENTVVSGPGAAVDAVLAELARAGVGAQRLPVSHAFHSPLMEPILDEFAELAGSIAYHAPRIPIVGNLTGKVSEAAPSAGYWRDHLRGTVRFGDDVLSAAEAGADVFLEVGPTAALLGMARRVVPQLEAVWVPSLRKGQDDPTVMAQAVAELYLAGVKLDWRALRGGRRRRRLPLPAYPFQRERFWFDSQGNRATGAARGPAVHPLLGSRLPTALPSTVFESHWAVRSPRFLVDHQVQGSVVVPGAAYAELGLAVAEQVFGPGTHAVENLVIQQAMFLTDAADRIVQVTVSPEQAGQAAFQVYSAPADGQAGAANWTLHASGVARHAEAAGEQTAVAVNAEAIRQAALDHSTHESFYQRLAARGLSYGPAFRLLHEIDRTGSEAVAEVRLPEELARQQQHYHLHPALLDGCLHAAAGVVPPETDGGYSPFTYMPLGMEKVRLWRRPEGELLAYAVRTSADVRPSPESLTADVLLLDSAGQLVAEVRGLRLQRIGRGAGGEAEVDPRSWLYEVQWRGQDLPADAPSTTAGRWAIFADRAGIGERLAERLAARGGQPVLVRPGESFSVAASEPAGIRRYTLDPLAEDDYRRLLEELAGDGPPLLGVVHLWSLDVPDVDDDDLTSLAAGRRLGCGSVLQLVRRLARAASTRSPQLWLVTSGAQAVLPDDRLPAVAQAPLWGLGRVAAVEHPELRCRLVDLEGSDVEPLLRELVGGDVENQLAFRGGQRFVARLAAAPDALASAAAAGDRLSIPRQTGYRLRIKSPGSFDSLWYEPMPPRQPGPGQVQIAVRAAGLNFSDVLKAMGLYPGITDEVVPLGIECAGVVTGVGPGVARFQVGDEVLGVAPYAFASQATSAEYALAHKPPGLDWEAAAAVPIAFLTAYYALLELARLRPGERVLIHAGAGGVGLAAIQIAQHLGAEVFATAGSPAKREFLQSLGVAQVFNSRTLDFADDVLRATDRRGVDVVLNSLPGEAIPKSISILSAYGRFLEIGKIDIYQNRMIGLLPFQDNLSYFAIDLDRMLRQRPDDIRRLFAEVLRHFEAGHYRPLPMTQFAACQTVDAFRYMAQRKNIGKVVVSMADDERAADSADQRPAGDVHAGASYLVTGGLGALGLQLAERLAQRGASHLLLLSRGKPSPAAAERVATLRARGTQVALLRGDVADREQVRRALADIPSEFPPLAGVFHAAGVLDDGVLFDMDLARLDRAMAPKVEGAWNLHLLTLDAPLEQFVLFSSVAALLGSPGQANYAAGNALLDALAHYRRARGLPASSVAWGPWADSGMAAEAGRDAQLAGRGMGLIPARQGFDLVERVLAERPVHLAVMAVRWRELIQAGGGTAPPLLADVAPALTDADAAGEPAEDRAFREQLLAADAAARQELLREYFTGQLSRIMGISPESLDLEQPLNTLGLDSLMAIELKNSIETKLRLVLPMARFMEGPSVHRLAEIVGETLAEAPTSAVAATARSDAGDARLPLSAGQRALWFLHRLAPHSSAYNICDAVRIFGPLSVPALESAVQGLVDRHPAFRTTFHDDEGQPYQQVHGVWPVAVSQEDAAGWTAAQINARISREIHHPFELESEPLLRVLLLRASQQEHCLVFVVHHLVADFWSLVTCTNEFRQFYEAAARGQSAALPPLRLSYTDFTRWQSEMLAGAEGEAHWQYWRQRLQGELPVLNLPTDRPRPPVQTFNGALAFREVAPELTERIRRLAESHGATLQTLLLAAYQVLLQRYTGQDDILVGVPTSGRTRAEFAPLVGYFVNPVVVRGDLSGGLSFRALIDQIRDRMLEALDHQDFSFPLLVQRLQPERDISRSPLVQTLFVFQKAQVMHEQGLTPFLMGQSGASLSMADLRFESMTLEQWVAQFDLLLSASEAQGGISLGLQFNTDLFDRATIERLLTHYAVLLESLVERPDAPVAELELLPPAERRQVLVDWNDTARPAPDAFLVYERFERQAAATPDAVAVVQGSDRLTYAELNARANRLAAWLRGQGVEPDDRVGICLPRCPNLVVAMLAVGKAGGAYVPLDPNYPRQRLEQIAASAAMKLVLSERRWAEKLQPSAAAVAAIDELQPVLDGFSAENLPRLAGPENLIYVIYTSGSTGRPKGAGVRHEGFANLVVWLTRHYRFGAEDRLLVITSHGFDLTQKMLLGPLTVGGAVHLSGGEFDPPVIRREIAAQGITLLLCTPSNLHGLVVDADERDLAQLDGLRLVQLAGEALDLQRMEAWIRRPTFRTQLSNAYGPTECTDLATFFDLDRPEEYLGRNVPIGRPLDNARIYVLSPDQTPLPIGVPGELWIGGMGVGAGYLSDPEQTAARFRPDPFAPRPGARIYRTGDLGRWLPDGTIEFLGRVDQQVKIRGFRIELGEIEATLREVDSVQEAVVLARDDARGETRLVAYVVPRPGHAPNPTELAEAVRARLPEYMVPWATVLLDRLPLNPHGKLDRRALPAPEWQRQAQHAGYLPPRDDLELQLVGLWEELLGVRPIGVRDEFFHLGGHSLLAVQLAARIRKQFGRELPLASLLQQGTIEALAHQLRTRSPQQDWSPRVALQPHGSRTPLVFVHPVGGNVLCYFDLAQRFDPEQPIYALQARGVDGRPPAESLDAMLDEYLRAIREAQPQGPYQLLGWSTGGVLAYELGRRLAAGGEPVSLVTMVDSRPPGELAVDPDDEAATLAEMARFLGRLFGVEAPVSRADLAPLESGERRRKVLQSLRGAGLVSEDLDLAQVGALVDVCRANLRALGQFVPQRSEFPLLLLRADDDSYAGQGRRSPPDLGWEALLGRPVEVVRVAGDHVTMLTGDSAARLAAEVAARLPRDKLSEL